MYRILAAIVAVCFFAISSPALAATTGFVRGVVTQSGTPQSGATVTLTGEGSTFTTRTDKSGQYSFSQIPFGHYRLTVRAGSTDRSVGVDVTSDSVATTNVELLATIAVTAVKAGAGVAGNPVAVTTIDKADIATSPVQDSLNRLIETVPGAVQFSYNEPVINGFHGVTYNIDGAPLPLATTSNFSELFDPKDIDSLEILTGAIPAEYGGDRMGAVVNIISDRFEDVPEGTYGTITAGAGNQSQAIGYLDLVSHFGNNEIFLNLDNSSTARGIDAPTNDALHDASSSSDEFLRWIHKIDDRSTLAFDFSNQFSQYQIPINTDPNDPNDPIYTPAGTDDTQLEYDRFLNLNYTQTSKDGNGVFQVIPWYRSTTVNYNGDLPNDVLALGPNFSCGPAGDPDNFPDCNVDGFTPNQVNGVGLQQTTYENYLGLRASELRSSLHHTWKVGFDVNRENSSGSQTFACYYVDCALAGGATPPTVASPANGYPLGYYGATSTQAQPGSQTGIYAQDKWQPDPNIVVDYGLRYDHSTGYTSGHMLEPRIGVNIGDGGKNILHVFYGRFYAAPLLEDVRQACVIFAAQNGCADQNTGATITNPVYDLQPEMDSYGEIGWQHNFGGNLSGWINIFQKNVVNVLDTTQLLNTPLFAVYNNSIGTNTGVELRFQDRMNNGDNWFLTTTISGSYAGGISGSTFLFPPGTNPPGVPISSPELLSIEDHSQTGDGTASYTHYFDHSRLWYGTIQANYGSGFPVQFQDANVNLNGTLPAHTTFDLLAGRVVVPGKGPDSQGLGVSLDVLNVLNHQYVIKVANGFNTTQVANGRTFLLRFTAPF
jgi:outer membrane receptor protein involved in Fe transport